MSIHPLRQALLSTGLLGAIFALNVGRVPHLGLFLSLLFTVAFVLVALAVVPDTHEVRERHREVLVPLPIPPRTLLFARAVHLVVLSALVGGPFALAPFLAAAWRFRPSLPTLLGEYLLLLVGAFTTTLLWLAAILVALRFVRVETVRRASQLTLVLFSLALALGSTLAVGLPARAGREPRLGGLGRALVDRLPPTWFARFGLAGPEGASVPERAAVLLLVAAAVALLCSGRLEAGYRRLTEQAPRAGRARPPLAAWALEALRGVPGIGERLLASRETAVAAAILTLGGREEVARLKAWVPRLMAVAVFALGLWGGGQSFLALSMLAYLLFSAAIEGVDRVSRSAHAEAGWAFAASPVPARDLARGLLLAVDVRFLALPFVLLAVLLLRVHPPVLAILLAAGAGGAARLAAAGAIVVRPALPLARVEQTTHGLVGFVAGFFLCLAGGLAYATAVLLAQSLGVVGLCLVAAGALLVLVAAQGARWLASRRLESSHVETAL